MEEKIKKMMNWSKEEKGIGERTIEEEKRKGAESEKSKQGRKEGRKRERKKERKKGKTGKKV